MTAYIKPIIWHWEGDETAITGNQPTSGARFTQDLPVGDAPYQVYSLATPNGIKVTIMLEELAELGISGVDYDLFKIDFQKVSNFHQALLRLIPTPRYLLWLIGVVRIWQYLNRLISCFIWQKNTTPSCQKAFVRGQRRLIGYFGRQERPHLSVVGLGIFSIMHR